MPVATFALCALAIWEAYARTSGIAPQVLPAPSRVLREGWAFRELIGTHAVPTLQASFLGFTLSMVVATVLAVVMDFSRRVRAALYPALVASQTIPIIALAPLMVIWFGFGLGPKVAVVALVTFFPITVGWVDGFKSTEAGAVQLLRSMGAGSWQVFCKVRLPSALPSFFSGLRIAIVYAVVGAIFAEYVGARYGLGIFMQLQKNSFRTDLVLAAMFVTATISIVLFLSTYLVERLVIPWHFAARRLTDR
ncbi:MAG: ABC transporter permease subunit [Dehalococcoidia bacterium]|nr:ABC transporter permease subunit [Dehalococcoidia bacterium]